MKAEKGISPSKRGKKSAKDAEDEGEGKAEHEVSGSSAKPKRTTRATAKAESVRDMIRSLLDSNGRYSLAHP